MSHATTTSHEGMRRQAQSVTPGTKKQTVCWYATSQAVKVSIFAALLGGPVILGYGIGEAGLIKPALSESFAPQMMKRGEIPNLCKEIEAVDKKMDLFFTFGILETFLLGCFVGTLVSNHFNNKYGPKTVLMRFQFAIIACAIIMFISPFIGTTIYINVILLAIGRLLFGFCAGVVIITAANYCTQIMSAHIRGTFHSQNQMSIAAGVLFAFFLTASFTFGNSSWDGSPLWSYGFGLMIIFPAIASLLIFVCARTPESPYWCVQHGEMAMARTSLKLIHNKEDVYVEMNEMEELVDRDAEAERNNQWSVSKVLRSKWLRKPLAILLTLHVIQQWSGINMFYFFIDDIFHAQGVDRHTFISLCALSLGIVNLVATILSQFFIDRSGRKCLLGASILMCLMTLVSITLLTYFGQHGVTLSTSGLPMDRCNPLSEDAFFQKTTRTFLTVLAVICTLIYIFAFASGLGPVPWFIGAEITPHGPRATVLGIAGLFNFLSTFIITALFDLVFLRFLGGALCLIFFIFAMLFGLLFLICIVPETKRRNLSAIYKQLGIEYDSTDPPPP